MAPNTLSSRAVLLSVLVCLSKSANALIGYPIEMYNPPCAFACRASIASLPLSCTAEASHHGMSGMSHGLGPTTAQCRAEDDSFLTTLAWCIKTRCEGKEAWRLEKYWADKTTGEKGLVPKWSYAEALARVEEEPKLPVQGAETLNFTGVVGDESWEAQRGTLMQFEQGEVTHSRYGIILLVVGFGIPIVCSMIVHLPFGNTLTSRLGPYLFTSISPENRLLTSLTAFSKIPTNGQLVYIVFFFLLNIILSAAGYTSFQPNTWFNGTSQEILAYISARTGVLAFALAPLVIIFSSRNNVLLWLTNWSHGTYLLLHRWVARIFTLQVIMHSILELILYIQMGEYKAESAELYWIWGIVATVACSAMIIFSLGVARRNAYEFFLVAHIILAVFVLVGSWYHVEFLFTRKWGYEFWLYAAFAVWGFDRAIRFLRVLKNGFRSAVVRDVGGGVFRVDVKGLRWTTQPGRHAYIFFPTLSKWKPWENHPFSIIPTSLLHSLPTTASVSSDSSSSSPSLPADIEKAPSKSISKKLSSSSFNFSSSGVSFYVRPSKGSTSLLKATSSLRVLLDGPYPSHPSPSILLADRLVLIAGGIGITAVLPFAVGHTNAKLYWSVKSNSEGLVQDLEGALGSGRIRENEVKIGARFDLKEVLEVESAGGWSIGVVVCGPVGMAEEVRQISGRLGRSGRKVDLLVEEFNW